MMIRQEFATKVQDLVNQAYLHDIDNKYYKGLMHEAEKLRYPITLAEFLGWEEGVEYRRGGNILKVEGNHLLDKRPNGKFHNTNCSTAELIDLRNATKYEPKFNCQEDLQDWLTRNWGEIEESVQKSIDTILCSNQGEFDVNNEVDRCLLRDFISDNLKMGLFNVIDTYEVE